MRVASLFLALLVLAAPSALSAASRVYQGASGVELDAAKKKLSDAQIKKILIEESIAAYSGNCPCPYSRARNGSQCGKRSAWSREGGEAPLCYPDDVTAEMVQAYRDAHPEA
jgi:hypothetical protein